MNLKRKCFLFFALVFVLKNAVFAKERFDFNIWSGVKTMRGERAVMRVTIPDNPNGTAVIICPGGSYHHLGVYNEGATTAKWFNSQNVVTFELWYRVANNNYHYPSQMQDIQRAICLVRENAERYKVDPSKLGVIGFSAGGHLVTWAGAFASRSNELLKIGIKTDVSLRPDFVIPVYPVVSMEDEIGHKWSRQSLIGKKASDAQKELFSMEKQIPFDMPPTYIVACVDDPVVLYENSVRLFDALNEKGILCEFHTYAWGGHGFGMQNNAFMKEFHWNEALKEWLISLGFLPSEESD